MSSPQTRARKLLETEGMHRAIELAVTIDDEDAGDRLKETIIYLLNAVLAVIFHPVVVRTIRTGKPAVADCQRRFSGW